jgi:hypothetical protein
MSRVCHKPCFHELRGNRYCRKGTDTNDLGRQLMDFQQGAVGGTRTLENIMHVLHEIQSRLHILYGIHHQHRLRFLLRYCNSLHLQFHGVQLVQPLLLQGFPIARNGSQVNLPLISHSLTLLIALLGNPAGLGFDALRHRNSCDPYKLVVSFTIFRNGVS